MSDTDDRVEEDNVVEFAKPAAVPVVGLGASAGGLEALETFFSKMAADSGAAFMVVMHLDPHHESMLVELLGRRTTMRVRAAESGIAVQPNEIYVIPPNRYLTLERGRLALSPLSPTHGTRLAVDRMLSSLAHDRGPRSVGIILSGTGTDGAMGIRAIKEQGGVVMVQAPGDAQYDGMPRAAIASELVDYVMPVGEIVEPLRHYLSHPYVAHTVEAPQALDELDALLDVLRVEVGHDFSAYARDVLQRRVHRRMGLQHVDSEHDYLLQVRDDPEERTRLFRDLLVGVTAFFRDPETFGRLRDDVLEPLARSKPVGEPLRIWVPGCASGEEAYTLAMLGLDAIHASGLRRTLQVFASDVDERALAVARAGLYPRTSLADVPDALRDAYFLPEGDLHRVSIEVREAVLFARHDVLIDPPFSNLDIISCRNLLSLLEPVAQRRLLARLHFALSERGAMVVGQGESLEPGQGLFVSSALDPSIATRGQMERREALGLISVASRRPRNEPRPPAPTVSPHEVLRAGLLEHFSPPSVLVDREGSVLYFHGELDPFLAIPRGQPTTSLFDRTRSGLRGSVRAAFLQSVRNAGPVTTSTRRFDTDEGLAEVRIHVRPLPNAPLDQAFLVVFEEVGLASVGTAERDGLAPNDRVSELELELAAVRAELEGTITALRMTNEELKTSNEQVSSMNEELQTSNEELMTSKEELQSLNEELITVNSQLQGKIQELEEANDDLSNLLESTEVATIFLDRDLRVRMFTPSASRHFSIVAHDIGRPIADVVRRFDDAHIMSDAERVLETATAEQREVKSEDGRWYARRVLPYLSSRGPVQGVLLTLTDIDPLKRAEVEVREARDDLELRMEARNAELVEVSTRLGEEVGVRSTLESELKEERARLQSILDTAEDAIIAVSGEGRIESTNPAAARLFGYEPGELVDKPWTTLLADTPPDAARKDPSAVDTVEQVLGLRKTGARFPIELSTGRAELVAGGVRYTVIVRDVSLKVTLEEQYRHAQKMEAIGRLTSGIAHDFNNLLMGLMGCAKAISRRLDEDSPARPYAEELEHAAERGSQITRDLLTFTRRTGPDGQTVDLGSLLPDVEGILRRMVGTEIELTVHVPDRDLSAKVGRGSMQQLVLNLVTNARDAIEGRGRITVRASTRAVETRTPLTAFTLEPGRYVVLTIEDDGHGMSKETLGRLFEPFFTTKDVGQGTGLGLSMAYSLVERCHGAIEVQSTRGMGTTIRVFLPEASELDEALRAPTAPTAMSAGDRPRGILIIEDEMLVRRAIAEGLADAGYRVFEAQDGEDALERWQQNQSEIDAVVSDIALPKRAGPDLVRLMRTERPTLPYLFMSAYPQEDLREKGRIPADAQSLLKPFEPEVLLGALELMFGD